MDQEGSCSASPSSGRSAYCLYSVGKDGKRTGQPRSILDTNGELTKYAYAEAAALAKKKQNTLTREEVIRILKQAIVDKKLTTGPGGKKCAVRGDDDFIDLMQLK